MARVGMVPCPVCDHKNPVPEHMLLRGGQFSCEKCAAALEFKAERPHPGDKVTVKLKTGSGSKSFDLVIRADGIWQFSGEIEREVTEALDRDSARASAVMAGSMVENRLTTAVLSRCQHVPRLKERNFHPSGAMGSFSIKIDLALMMRIISEDAYKDLGTIKDIRNAFAHRTDIKDFSSQWVRDKVNNLRLIENHVGEFENKKGAKVLNFSERKIYVYDIKKRKKIPRDRFMITAQLLMVCLAPGELPDYPLPLI